MDWFTLEVIVLLWVIAAPVILVYWVWLESYDHEDRER